MPENNKISLEHKCEQNFSVLWLLHAIVACYFDLSWQNESCTPILSTGHISSHFFCPWFLVN
jgi:hypothetical protein